MQRRRRRAGHRPVLQVVKVETVTDTVFKSDADAPQALAQRRGPLDHRVRIAQLEGAITAGCLVRVTKYSSTNELNIRRDGDRRPAAAADRRADVRRGLAAAGRRRPAAALPPPPSGRREIEARSRPRPSPRRRGRPATATLSAATPPIERSTSTSAARPSRRRSRRSRGTRTRSLARSPRTAATRRAHLHRPRPDALPLHPQLPAKRVLAAPADDDAKRELLVEAEFYGMHDFARARCARPSST